MKVEIEHIIDETSKEIYQFENYGNWWHYTGITYSHRNGEWDTWGDEWDEKFKKQRDLEYDEVAQNHGYSNYGDSNYDYFVECDIYEVRTKYNPVCQKTTDGRPYLSGCYWGLFSEPDGDRPAPKMTNDQIKEAIAKQISKIKIKL